MTQKQMIQNMQGDIRTLSENMGILTKRVDTLTENMAVLTERVNILTQNMGILTKRMDTLTENVGSLIEIVHFMKDNMASKQDLEYTKFELRQEIRETSDEIRGEMKEMENRLMNHIDGFVGYNQKFDTELTSTTSTVRRHDRYIHGVAKHVGYELG